MMNPERSVRVTGGRSSFQSIKFDKLRLTSELLALGHYKITQQIAELVSQEVEDEVGRRKGATITSELISDLVALKLEELGLIQKKAENKTSSKSNRSQKISQNKLTPEVLDVLVCRSEKASENPIKTSGSVPKVDLLFSTRVQDIFKTYFCATNSEGEVLESPAERLTRVARSLARADLKYNPTVDLQAVENTFFNIMAATDFMPEPQVLRSAGRSQPYLTSSFVIPIDDSTESIFEALKQSAVIHKYGGICGFSFSNLRPFRDVVQSTEGQSSGPVSFMKVFYSSMQMVAGRGLNEPDQGVLRVDHPDIFHFVECEDELARNAPIQRTVGVTGEFIRAVEKDEIFILKNPRNPDAHQEVRARKIFRSLVHQIGKYRQPDILFLDTINDHNPIPDEAPLAATNANGDQPLAAYETCVKGSLNMSRFIRDGGIDWERLRSVIHAAVHFLDNIFDVTEYPLPQIREHTRKNRKIGLGVMGWAGALARLGVVYASDEALALAEEVMKFVHEAAGKASHKLAMERGVFANFATSRLAQKGTVLRNATVTTIYAAAVESMLCECSPGIEPFWFLDRSTSSCEGLLQDILRCQQFNPDVFLPKVFAKGNHADLSELPHRVRALFATGDQIDPDWHLRMQAAFQKHVDNGVFKRIEVLPEAKEDEIARIVLIGHQLGLKALQLKWASEHQQRDAQVSLKSVLARNEIFVPNPRPKVVSGVTKKINCDCGDFYLTINQGEGRIVEILIRPEKPQGCEGTGFNTIARLVSLCFQAGIPLEVITEQLAAVKCQQHTDGSLKSIGQALAQVLSQPLIVESPPQESYFLPDQPAEPLSTTS